MPENTGIGIQLAAPRSIAGIAAFRNRDGLLAALQAEFGVAVPTAPRWVEAAEVMLSCLAPNRFLATADRAANLPNRLAKSLAGLAVVTDQSDFWITIIVSGPSVRDMLARVVPIDLDPAKFSVGDLALTRGGHLDVRLWRVAEDSYEVAASRSYAQDFRHLLKTAAREGLLF
jgi:sarcosine oxidase subunit gamma